MPFPIMPFPLAGLAKAPHLQLNDIWEDALMVPSPLRGALRGEGWVAGAPTRWTTTE
jgi:hypothetical protein